MADDERGSRGLRPIGGLQQRLRRSARGQRFQRAKIEAERRCGLLRTYGRTDQDTGSGSELRFQPCGHFFCLYMSGGGKCARYVRVAVFRFGMAPEYEFHKTADRLVGGNGSTHYLIAAMDCGKATSVNLKLYFAQSLGLLADGDKGSPALQRLLAAGRRTWIDEPLPIVLCREFGVGAQTDWPLAALSWLGEGNDPGADGWLQAEPVHLALQRDYFSLSHPVPLVLSRADAEALTAVLNQHFAIEGLQFHLGHERGQGTRWYLRLAAAPRLRTTLPQQAAGHDIRPFLPQGADAPFWQRLTNEIQMLLHDHPVNQAREASGQLAVNSIWFSAGGVLPASVKISNRRVFADLPLAAGLAQVTGAQLDRLPQDGASLMQVDGDGLLILADADNTEQRWLAPLLQAMQSRRLKRLELYLGMDDRVLAVQLRWFDLWRLWHRPQPLSVYLSA